MLLCKVTALSHEFKILKKCTQEKITAREIEQLIENEKIIPQNHLKIQIAELLSSRSPDRWIAALFADHSIYLQLFIALTHNIPHHYSLGNMLISGSYQNRAPYRYVNLFSISRNENIGSFKIAGQSAMRYFFKAVKEFLVEHQPHIELTPDFQIRTFSPIMNFSQWLDAYLELYIVSPTDINPLRNLIESFPISEIPDSAFGAAPVRFLNTTPLKLGTLISPANNNVPYWRYQPYTVKNTIREFLVAATTTYIHEFINIETLIPGLLNPVTISIDPVYAFHTRNGATPSHEIYQNYDLQERQVPFGTSYLYPRKI